MTVAQNKTPRHQDNLERVQDLSLSEFERLDRIMDILAHPETGCMWVIDQAFEDIALYTLEEAYEVYEAILNNDMENLKEELGDLILQSLFHAYIAKNKGAFDMSDVLKTLNEKLIRRHPHIFDDWSVENSDDIRRNWDLIKKREKEQAGVVSKDDEKSALGNIPRALPALVRSHKIQRKAENSGFRWPDDFPRETKVYEELDELKQAIAEGDKDAVKDEFGDLLFALVGYGMSLGVNAEESLRQANMKFERRFQVMEQALADDKTPLGVADFETMDSAWKKAKIKTAETKS